ncbi:MAG TPA: hypothetical protein VIJ72_00155 [Rhizomicrobium sp.]
MFAVLLLCGCATSQAVLKTQTVNVPVALSCKPDIGSAPAYPDTPSAIAAAPDIFARTKLLLAGRMARIQREAELTVALAACG